MYIQIEPHTLLRAIERGAFEEEIRETIITGLEISAKGNRLGKTKAFNYNQYRNEKFYEHKKLEVYYVIEDEKIVTVTVYVFYGKFLI